MAGDHPELTDLADEVAAVAHEVGKAETWNMREALDALKQIRQLRLEVDQQLRQIELEAAQEAFRLTARWGDIAQAAGVTRQTAQATYRDRENKPRRQPRRVTPQPLNPQARRPSARDTNSWRAAME